MLLSLEVKDWKGGVEMRSEEVWILDLGGGRSTGLVLWDGMQIISCILKMFQDSQLALRKHVWESLNQTERASLTKFNLISICWKYEHVTDKYGITYLCTL